MSTVRRKREDIAPLTEERKAELKAMAQLPASAIDYSDIQKLGDNFWNHAVRGKFFRPIKTQTSVRIDSDVLMWLKSQGKGYQTRLNSILRNAMLHEVKSKR